MLVSELLALLPGPQALEGALLEAVVKCRMPVLNSVRIVGGKWIEKIASENPKELEKWRVVERPPLYQNPAARYCRWCKEALYAAYSPKDGLTPGWCSVHGKDVPVLHASTNPLTSDEDFWVPVEAESKYQAQTPKEAMEDVEYVRRKLFDALKVPKEYLVDAKQAGHDAFLKELGFESKTEFRRLAGITGS